MKPHERRSLALITGASSGIGLALAEVFARHQYDLFLVARDETQLLKIAKKLKDRFGINADFFAQDLTLSGSPQKIIEALNQVPGEASPLPTVDVLVNSAGFGLHGAFQDTSFQREAEMVTLQITNTLHLTKLLLPSMIRQKSGHILNIASVYATCPVPYQAVYGACKAFMLSFSDALRAEVEDFGINVTVVCPGSTRTEFRSRMGVTEKSKTSGMSATQVAEAAFKAFSKNQSLVVPGFVNNLFMMVIRWLPRTAAARLMIRINRARGVDSGVNDQVIR